MARVRCVLVVCASDVEPSTLDDGDVERFSGQRVAFIDGAVQGDPYRGRRSPGAARRGGVR